MSEIFDAARKGDVDRVRSLVEQGIDKETTDVGSLLHVAALNGRLKSCSIWFSKGRTRRPLITGDWTPLNHAACWGHLEIVEYLLDQGADRDSPNHRRFTPLHFAAMIGYLEIVQCLMSYGADINANNDQGQTPLDVATTEDIRQAIRDVEQQRYDANFGKKRISEADLRPPAPPSKETKVGDEEGEEDEDEDESSEEDEDEDADEDK